MISSGLEGAGLEGAGLGAPAWKGGWRAGPPTPPSTMQRPCGR